jgi:UDP-glucose 4-epimerase
MTDTGGRRVLVTGGAGFIGSHVSDAFLAAGDDVWIVDDLSSGKEENLPGAATFRRLDISEEGLEEVFREAGGFDVVSHHAAQIDVRRSVNDPAFDARVNGLGLLRLLECCRRYGTSRVVYVSSGGVVYGEPDRIPTPETFPKLPLSPYGVTKLAGEFYLNYYRVVHGMEYVALRYSNVYGPRQDPHGEAGVVAIFSTRLLKGEPLTIFGDGMQTRDYVFVGDVVAANLMAADMELDADSGLDSRAYNVGTGVATSVNVLADTLERVAGGDVGRTHAAARPGELQNSTLDVTRLRARGWTPARSLEEGLRETYHWIAARTGGKA